MGLDEGYDFHFIAIGGVGQSALAKILLQLGYKVSGSDITDSKYTKLVSSLGARVTIGHNKKNIIGTPKVVVSSAIKEDNPELMRAKELKLEIMHRSDCLKFISENFPKFIGFAGTHGKTTTSGLCAFILESMKKNPAYAIGGIIPKLETNAFASKDSKYFIAELDESDGTIQKYSLDYFVVNNLEKDHPDFYKNGLDDIIPVFEKTVDKLKKDAKVFLNIDSKGVVDFLNQTKAKNIITYSVEAKADYTAENIAINGLESSFDVYKKDKLLGKINLIIPGIYNIYNALSVVCILDSLGFNFSDYSRYFCDFSGMKRRFQLVFNKNNIKLYDDYAHHPSEIKSAIGAIKGIKNRKVVIFQPHRYSRFKDLWDEFSNSFDGADKLYILDVFSAGDKFDSQYNSFNFAKMMIEKRVDIEYIEGNIEQAAGKIAPNLKQGDVVLALGAGDITKIGGFIDDFFAK